MRILRQAQDERIEEKRAFKIKNFLTE